jgi:hypothetical protein
MAREITHHKFSNLNELIRVEAVDEPGPGGACHEYLILWSHDYDKRPVKQVPCLIRFQKGALQEVGLNGGSDEALLAVVIDRLQSFQAGPFACRENALALTKIQEALHWLNHRTRDRMARGVEGQSKP